MLSYNAENVAMNHKRASPCSGSLRISAGTRMCSTDLIGQVLLDIGQDGNCMAMADGTGPREGEGMGGELSSPSHCQRFQVQGLRNDRRRQDRPLSALMTLTFQAGRPQGYLCQRCIGQCLAGIPGRLCREHLAAGSGRLHQQRHFQIVHVC